MAGRGSARRSRGIGAWKHAVSAPNCVYTVNLIYMNENLYLNKLITSSAVPAVSSRAARRSLLYVCGARVVALAALGGDPPGVACDGGPGRKRA